MMPSATSPEIITAAGHFDKLAPGIRVPSIENPGAAHEKSSPVASPMTTA
jgi:hypothetical protein